MHHITKVSTDRTTVLTAVQRTKLSCVALCAENFHSAHLMDSILLFFPLAEKGCLELESRIWNLG